MTEFVALVLYTDTVTQFLSVAQRGRTCNEGRNSQIIQNHGDLQGKNIRKHLQDYLMCFLCVLYKNKRLGIKD